MATLYSPSVSVPVFESNVLGFAWSVQKADLPEIEMEVVATLNDDFLPVTKKDAVALIRITDAVMACVRQLKTNDPKYRKFVAASKKWTKKKDDLIESGEAEALLVHMKKKPVNRGFSKDTVAAIEPLTEWVKTTTPQWVMAKKHTVTFYGEGKKEGQPVWSGTLSSFVTKKPTVGMAAGGCTIR